MGHLLDALGLAYRVLGFEEAADGDEVFRHLVLARIIEAVSKLDSLRVRRKGAPSGLLPYGRAAPAGLCGRGVVAAVAGLRCARPARPSKPRTLRRVHVLLRDRQGGRDSGSPGFSEEWRLEPQITIGLLTGQEVFPLMVSAFEGNKAETKTMLPVIERFMAAHNLPDVTVVADAGMVSESNQ